MNLGKKQANNTRVEFDCQPRARGSLFDSSIARELLEFVCFALISNKENPGCDKYVFNNIFNIFIYNK